MFSITKALEGIADIAWMPFTLVKAAVVGPYRATHAQGTCPSCRKQTTFSNYRYCWYRCQHCRFPFLGYWLVGDMPSFKGHDFTMFNPTYCHFCNNLIGFGSDCCSYCTNYLWNKAEEWPQFVIEHIRANSAAWDAATIPDRATYLSYLKVEDEVEEEEYEDEEEEEPVRPTIDFSVLGRAAQVQAPPFTRLMGTWRSGVQYEVGDAVLYGGMLFICLMPNINRTPYGSSYWRAG